ncbi:hypothetical protein F5Y16DRAFT_265100 [Xylariaceae sp. FL0255]|nr:hypothetical protein F5Y16DRAFT_265100 [Xylariaceae sp. FL0255]
MADVRKESAATRFAGIGELLLVLSDYIDDRSTLWALCLTNWRLNHVFTPKLFELVVVRIERDSDEDEVDRVINGLLQWPYLHGIPHLQLDVDNGPEFSERTVAIIEKLLAHVPGLKKFNWNSTRGDIPIRVLVALAINCPLTEELHMRCGPEINKGPVYFDDSEHLKFFRKIRTFTSNSASVGLNLRILERCTQLETVEMTHMRGMAEVEWMGWGYHRLLKSVIKNEEKQRLRSGKMLTIRMCYSRSAHMTHWCKMCQKPGNTITQASQWVSCWPWSRGNAMQFISSDRAVRHVEYTYDPPKGERRRQQLDMLDAPEHELDLALG